MIQKGKSLFVLCNIGVDKSHRNFLFMQTFTYVMSNTIQYGISLTICILSSSFRDTIPSEDDTYVYRRLTPFAILYSYINVVHFFSSIMIGIPLLPTRLMAAEEFVIVALSQGTLDPI